MKILAIETSCDETAVSLVETDGANFSVLGDSLFSQVEMHKEYGGVYPSVAKREHSKNLTPLLLNTLKESGLYVASEGSEISKEQFEKIKELLFREPELFVHFVTLLSRLKKPDIDAIAVTSGPGLEPALWVGINFAKALSLVWDLPLVPINHMEGHIIASLMKNEGVEKPESPSIALLISGGHTELVLMNKIGEYKVIGETKDDAVGEAFDKVARMMGLEYPGGPEISKLAEMARKDNLERKYELPRPMIHEDSFDFSFSGLKTAVLYLIKDIGGLSEEDKKIISREFEDAVTEVLVSKTKRAVEEYGAKSVIVGGGVSANKNIREAVTNLKQEYTDLSVYIPDARLSTDNAIMIATVAYFKLKSMKPIPEPGNIVANGNLSL
ncbi:MAG: tRNA (adenosine(37)-N6)-threonylcarbamoyltransferase complex transferase subunit TsaD [Parcubacteria group bacterium]|nr:tRNA (adenosine(37)-N6)-threonylcarbamoyltransferase complex transferase subunit TsaD [Parcubacteria group bacterium]